LRRRTNHHGTTYPFRELSIPFESSGCGAENVSVPNLKDVFHRSVRSLPSFATVHPNFAHSIQSGVNITVGVFPLRLFLTLLNPQSLMVAIINVPSGALDI
jgi:hypothetical protein